MSDQLNSILEMITQDLEQTLRGVNRTGGYRTTFYVERPANLALARRDGLCVVVEREAEKVTSPLGWQQWMQRYFVAVFLHRSETSDFTQRTRTNNAIADVHKVVKVDPTRGGFAIHTWLDEPETTIDGEFDRVVVPVRVMYRHLINNPFSQG